MSTVTVRPARFLDWLARDRSRVVALGAVAVLLASGVGVAVLRAGSEGLGVGEARLLPDGQVEISLAGAEFIAAADGTVITTDDRVRVVSGKAVLELPGGTRAEMRSGSHVRLGGTDGPRLKLDRGDLLLEVSGQPLTVDGGSAVLAIEPGAAKLRRSASLLVGAYSGQITISGSGRSLDVDPLRQAAVAGTGTIPSEVRPLALEEDDEWDRRILGSVLDLDRRLVAFGRGFEALLPDASGASPSLYREVLPSLAGAPLASSALEGRAAGENLIGLTLVALAGGPFEERFADVFGFREAGARWGLVAVDQGLEAASVVDGVEAAIDRAPVEVAAPDEVPGDGSGGSGGSGGGGGGGSGGGGGGSGGGGGGGGGGAEGTTTTQPRTTTTSPGAPTTTTTIPGGGGTTTTTQPTTTTTSPLCDFLPTC